MTTGSTHIVLTYSEFKREFNHFIKNGYRAEINLGDYIVLIKPIMHSTANCLSKAYTGILNDFTNRKDYTMDKNEFKTLQVGDKVKFMNNTMTITMIETETDYSEYNPYTGEGKVGEFTWKVHYNTGTNNEITDSIVKYLRKL